MPQTQAPHAKDLRKGRSSVPGQIYLVTTKTLNRRRVFLDLYDARLLIACFKHLQEIGYAQTLAFVVMPDHLHWLLQVGAEKTLSEVVRRAKGAAARSINARHGSADGMLWQSGFHDHALRREEDLREVARYIVANPLRAGLVGRVGDYPHWDAVWL
jgi:REP element-mobilizing transposase RayT